MKTAMEWCELYWSGKLQKYPSVEDKFGELKNLNFMDKEIILQKFENFRKECELVYGRN